MSDGSRRVTRWRRFAAWLLFVPQVVVLDGCANRGVGPDGAPDPIPVAGTERITWSILVLSWHRPELYQYVAYIDGRRVPLSDVRCERADAMTYTCIAPLPPLRAGRHEIRVATMDTEAGSESARSGAIVVVITPGM